MLHQAPTGRSDGRQLLAGDLGHPPDLLRVVGEALGRDRLRPVADRLLGLVVDLDDDPVGARRRPPPATSARPSRAGPAAWLGSTTTGRCVSSRSAGTASRSSVNR